MNAKKQTAIGVFESELRDKLCRQNDEDYIFSDLTGLYTDIIGVISEADRAKTGIIHDYAKLLQQEIQLYSGTEAYIAGREAKDKPENEVINAYMCRAVKMSGEQRLDSRIQECFNEIFHLLGDCGGLITEFTETYRAVHGIVPHHIHEFVRLGQTSGTDMTA